jgi:hypothetical protein
MGKINSRAKGCRGERLCRDLFRQRGFEARRGQQFSGSPDSPDVVIPGLPQYHVEVKFVENLNVLKAMEQSIHDSRPDQIPLVFHKKSNTPWLVTISADHFLDILVKLHDEQNNKNSNANIPTAADGETGAGGNTTGVVRDFGAGI